MPECIFRTTQNILNRYRGGLLRLTLGRLLAEDYSLLCDDLMNRNVMLFGREYLYHLKFESQPYGWSFRTQHREESIVVSHAMSQPIPAFIEGDARDND